MKRIALGILLLIILTPLSGWSASHYIRAGATGSANGNDWTNAWTALPGTLVRGDEYFIASGSYAPYTFSSLAGTSRVLVCKATVSTVGSCSSAHGTATGWSDSYATGQAIFTSTGIQNIIIRMAYLTIDGVTGSLNSGHGFKFVNNQRTRATGANVWFDTVGYADNLILKHIEMSSPDPTADNTTEAFNMDSYCWGCPDSSLYQYLYLHGGLVSVSFTGTNQTIEYSWMQNNGGQEHGEMIDVVNAQNTTIRYNMLQDMLCFPTTTGCATTYIEPQSNGGVIPNGIYVYGNIFRATVGTGLEGCNNASMFSSTQGEQVLNVYIYNNTVYGLAGGPNGNGTGVDGSNSSSTITVRNNIWQNCAQNPGFQNGTITQDHNILNTGGVSFVSAATGNFHLSSQTTQGYAMVSPYNIDPDGTTRSYPSIGAYEYGTGGDTTPPTVTISTSSPQTIYADSLTVTGTATDDTGVIGCKWRIGAEPNAGAGTGCTGTTSWSCATSGYSTGANTLYVECYDAFPHYSTGNSITVNYSIPNPSGLWTGSFKGVIGNAP